MRLWVKVGLFLSSYLPLFLILVIKNWFNLYLTIFITIISIICLFIWIAIINISKKGTAESFKVLKAEEKTKESLNYLIPYIISFIGFDLNKWQDWSALVILLAILFVVYLNSDLLYINPLLSFFKYKIYNVEVCKPTMNCEETKAEILLITEKNRIKKDDEITVKDIDEGIVLEVN
jgi:cellulose synthase/poly-beta-1,6-N-acetylglucosamine synthase-like glycosyltransferase